MSAPGRYVECSRADLAPLLGSAHYLGPARAGRIVFACAQVEAGEIVAGMIWKLPSSRRLPSDGSWADLTRWVLTPSAGVNAGTRMHSWVVGELRRRGVSTAITYADPAVGHTGAVYRACNYLWAPVWHELRPPPTGQGSWDDGRTRSGVKRRFTFHLAQPRRVRPELLVDDRGAVRAWVARVGPDVAQHQAVLSPYVRHALGLL